MKRIEPSVLKQLAEARNLSLTELAKQTKIDKQTIWRLAHGKQTKTRARTVEQIARILKVEPAVLTGEVPVPQVRRESESPTSKAQLNVRVGTAARNALNLVALRYRVEPSQIVELAPFLFFWAAEESLRQRRGRLSIFERALDETKAIGEQARHLCPQISIFEYADDAMDAERASIDRRDLFGSSIELDLAGVPSDFDDDKENPFAMFLRNLVVPFAESATFEEWSGARTWGPRYRICLEEAAEIVGGDRAAADEILNGFVAVHEMPKEIRKPEMFKERAEWVRAKAEEYRRQCADALAELDLLTERKEVST